jgi:lysophospholipase L1-like esterase
MYRYLKENLRIVESYGAAVNFVGDSITYGYYAYGPIFVDMFRDKMNELFGTGFIPVNNMGESGFATGDFVTTEKLNEVMIRGTATSDRNNLFIIGLGTNDIYSVSAAVSSDVYKQNLKTLIEHYQNGYKNFVFLTVPIVCEVNEIVEPFINYKNVVYDLAAEYGLNVIDYSRLNITEFLSDDIHPLTGGHELMYERLIETFAFREISNSKMIAVDTNLTIPVWLQHYWNMDSTSTTETDMVGNKNGVATATTSFTGTFGKAKKFNGLSSKITINDLTLPTDFTLLFNLVNQGTIDSHIFSSFNGGSTMGFSITRYSDKLYLYSQAEYNVSPANLVELCALTDVPNGSKVALTIQTNFAKLYVNGTQIKTIANIMPLLDKGQLNIGVGANSTDLTWGYYWDGAIDEVAICNVLTESQILGIANATTPLIS